jgi:2-iminobutanoate/2-iminopropanoate deaminase
MDKHIIHSDRAPEPIGPYNQAIEANGFLFISGQIAIDTATGDLLTGDLKTETLQVMKNLEAILHSAGLNFDAVVKSSIFLTDMNDFATVNQVYGGFFGDNAPARETVQVARLPKNVNVEISMIALK